MTFSFNSSPPEVRVIKRGYHKFYEVWNLFCEIGFLVFYYFTADQDTQASRRLSNLSRLRRNMEENQKHRLCSLKLHLQLTVKLSVFHESPKSYYFMFCDSLHCSGSLHLLMVSLTSISLPLNQFIYLIPISISTDLTNF